MIREIQQPKTAADVEELWALALRAIYNLDAAAYGPVDPEAREDVRKALLQLAEDATRRAGDHTPREFGGEG